MIAGVGIAITEALGGIEALAVSVETAVAIEATATIVTAVDVGAVAAKTVVSISSVKNIEESDVDRSFSREAENKTVLYKDIEISDQQLKQVMDESVIKVERMCESKWQYFPSGILTPFTWLIFGQALRHEFVLIHTVNHLCLIEAKKQYDQALNLAAKYQLFINFYPCDSQAKRKELRKELLKDRRCDRQLSEVKVEHNLKMNQINSFINLVLTILRQIPDGKLPTIMEKIDKQIARAIFYFSQQKVDFNVLLQTIFGIYTDKPLYIPRLDMILMEKLVWRISEMFNMPKQALQQLIIRIQTILNGQSQIVVN